MRLGVMGMLACGAGEAIQVEVLEEQGAQVVPLGGGEAYTVPRTSLPARTREGDVVRDGQVDEELGARLAREVMELRARLSVPVPDGLDLDSGSAESLTESKER